MFGYLKSIEFKDGDYVKEGQTLFTIEPDEYEATHQQSLSKIDLYSANLELEAGDPERAEALFRESVSLLRGLGSAWLYTPALYNLGRTVWMRGDAA